MMDEPRFYSMSLDEENTADAIDSVSNDECIGIVDEQCGGIIAYAIGEPNAQRIVLALAALEQP